MNTQIPLMVQSPDFAGSMMNGLNAGGMARQAGQQNALANLYQTQGPQIMAGDPGALNALARMDPNAAMGVQQNQLGMASTRQNMAFDGERMQMMREQAKAQAAEAAKKESAEAVAAEIAETTRIMGGAAPLLMAWQKNNDPAAAQALIAYLGRNGIQTTPETLIETIYSIDGAVAGLKLGAEAMAAFAPVEPPKPADDYQRYVQEENAAGRKPLSRLEFSAANRAPPSSLSIVTSPDGTQTVTQGPGAGTAKPGQIAVDPIAVDSVVGSIDSIMNDPALNKVVGPLEGSGGNDVDQLGPMASWWAGGDGLALIQKVSQLQSTTWLAARAMLKGGGPITDYESRKAEAAMARLSRKQSEAEFKAALKDLRDAITEGQAKLAGSATGAVPDSGSPQTLRDQLSPELQAIYDKYKKPVQPGTAGTP